MYSLKGKCCRHCNNHKPYEDFHDNKEMRDGKSSYCKPCAIEKSRVWKENNRDRAKDTELKSKYGISFADHAAMFARQGGRCAICGVEESDAPRKTLFVDHCHETGVVRGLLCHHCNSGIGHFMDNPDFILSALSYLTEEERGNCSAYLL